MEDVDRVVSVVKSYNNIKDISLILMLIFF